MGEKGNGFGEGDGLGKGVGFGKGGKGRDGKGGEKKARGEEGKGRRWEGKGNGFGEGDGFGRWRLAAPPQETHSCLAFGLDFRLRLRHLRRLVVPKYQYSPNTGAAIIHTGGSNPVASKIFCISFLSSFAQ